MNNNPKRPQTATTRYDFLQHKKSFDGSSTNKMNPFNPIRNYILKKSKTQQEFQQIANRQISYFSNFVPNKQDLVYQQMIKTRLNAGLRDDTDFNKFMVSLCKTKDQSEQILSNMKDQVHKQEKELRHIKNIDPKDAHKHIKQSRTDFIISQNANIKDPVQFKKLMEQQVRITGIRNLVERLKYRKKMTYLNQVINEIKQNYRCSQRPIKYLINNDKDVDALAKPIMVPVMIYKALPKPTEKLDLSKQFEIDFFPTSIEVEAPMIKETLESDYQQFKKNEKKKQLIDKLGFKIRQLSDQKPPSSKQKQSSVDPEQRKLKKNLETQEAQWKKVEEIFQQAEQQQEQELMFSSFEQSDMDQSNLFLTKISKSKTNKKQNNNNNNNNQANQHQRILEEKKPEIYIQKSTQQNQQQQQQKQKQIIPNGKVRQDMQNFIDDIQNYQDENANQFQKQINFLDKQFDYMDNQYDATSPEKILERQIYQDIAPERNVKL